MKELRELINKAIEIYNRYRSPEAVAKLVRLDKDRLILDISGPYCRSCGLSDWFEDFSIELAKISNYKAELAAFEATDDEIYRVDYILKEKISDAS